LNTLNTRVTGIPTWTVTPDGQGRPYSIAASTGQNPVSSTTYNLFSLPTGVTFGSLDSNSFSYDANTGRMTQYRSTVNTSTMTGALSWNASGSLRQLAITDPFNAGNAQTCVYTHDDLARLSKVDCGTKWGQSFAYDAFGNISKSVLPGATGIPFLPTYNTATNRYQTLPAGTPTYDANGNLTYDVFHRYGWDAEGKLNSLDLGATTMTYDALGRRVEQATGATYTVILYGPDGGKLALMNGETVIRVLLPLPGRATAVYASTGLSYYRHSDWLGSARFASTPARTMYKDRAYAPFGEPYAEADTTDRNFTGQNQDLAGDLYDFAYREYHPTQGRWTTPDPAGQAAAILADPQSWNGYVYVRSSPDSSVDPLGLKLVEFNGCLFNVVEHNTTEHSWITIDLMASGPRRAVVGGSSATLLTVTSHIWDQSVNGSERVQTRGALAVPLLRVAAVPQ
jgi:RHS repeat-associated protein